MKIWVLCENTALSDEFLSEHGLSLFIEVNGKKVLFDMGQSTLFEKNAKKLGVDLTSVDFAVLSHGHYDHGGGLERFLSINNKAKIYMSKFAFEPHFNGCEKYIGLDTSLKDSSRLTFIDEKTDLGSGFLLYPSKAVTKRTPLLNSGLTVKKGNVFENEDFRHEIYLQVKEKEKTILFSGCSHNGIINIASLFKPDLLIGGFHFSKLPTDNTLIGYAKELDAYQTHFYTCHCTGIEQYGFMKKHMSRLNYLSCGKYIEI